MPSTDRLTTAVVPFGSGIGDMVNMRPLLEAVQQARPGRNILCLAPPGLEWLLPAGITPISPGPFMSAWTRIPRNGWAGRIGANIDARVARQAVRVLQPRLLAHGLAAYLRAVGNDEVVNFLEAMTELDLDNRWTAGRWSSNRRHIIDLLADTLEARGIPVPLQDRRPRVSVETDTAVHGSILLNPNAGSNLKEPPLTFWIELARQLIAAGHLPVVLAAPAQDAAVKLVAAVPQMELLRDSLAKICVQLATARLVISPDTGVLHLAAACGTPFVGLFGPTDPLFLGPYHPERGIILETTTPHARVCRGCWAAQILPEARCAMALGAGCIAELDPVDACDAALALLAHGALAEFDQPLR